jgi:hypothetical protein
VSSVAHFHISLCKGFSSIQMLRLYFSLQFLFPFLIGLRRIFDGTMICMLNCMRSDFIWKRIKRITIEYIIPISKYSLSFIRLELYEDNSFFNMFLSFSLCDDEIEINNFVFHLDELFSQKILLPIDRIFIILLLSSFKRFFESHYASYNVLFLHIQPL